MDSLSTVIIEIFGDIILLWWSAGTVSSASPLSRWTNSSSRAVRTRLSHRSDFSCS